MHAKRSKMRPLVVTLALLTAPGIFLAKISAGYDSVIIEPSFFRCLLHAAG